MPVEKPNRRQTLKAVAIFNPQFCHYLHARYTIVNFKHVSYLSYGKCFIHENYHVYIHNGIKIITSAPMVSYLGILNSE